MDEHTGPKCGTILHLFDLKTNLPQGATINFEALVKERSGLGSKGTKYKSKDCIVASSFECIELNLPKLLPKTKLFLRLRVVRLGYADRKGQYVDITPTLGLQQKFFWKLAKNGITTTTQVTICLSSPQGMPVEDKDGDDSDCSTSSHVNTRHHHNNDSHHSRPSWLSRTLNPFTTRRPSSASSSSSESQQTAEDSSSPNSSMLSSRSNGVSTSSNASGPLKKPRFGSLSRLLPSARSKNSAQNDSDAQATASGPHFKLYQNRAADLEEEEHRQEQGPKRPAPLERTHSNGSGSVDEEIDNVEAALDNSQVASPVARQHRETLKTLRGASASRAESAPEPEVVQGILASIKDDIAPFCKGEQQADGRYLTQVALRNGETLAVRADYASFDQSTIKADKACVCISFAVGCWFDMYASRRLDGHTFEQLMVEGGKQWQRLCQQEDIQDDYPSGMLDFECVMNEYSDRLGEVLEINCQISHKGAQSRKTTLRTALEERKAGVYLMTCCGHCVAVRVMEDGTVQMANSLGRSLAQSCKLGHVITCANMQEFIMLYVGMNQPESGAVQVEIHQISLAARGNKGDFIMMSPQ